VLTAEAYGPLLFQTVLLQIFLLFIIISLILLDAYFYIFFIHITLPMVNAHWFKIMRNRNSIYLNIANKKKKPTFI